MSGKEKASKGKRRNQVDDQTLCRSNDQRYRYSRQSGHDDYIESAILNEDFFLGAGKQWSEADRAARGNRPTVELNHILPAVQTALGMQLHSRVDMNFLPRGQGADEKKASVITKIVRQICDDVEYHWKESQQFADGLIQRRGYLELRVDFTSNFQGEIICDILDPLDVHVDPDSQSYTPDGWQDVLVTRWLPLDEIISRYGEDKAKELEQLADAFFEDDQYKDRSKFGKDADASGYDGWVKQDDDREETRLYLVIDRQHRKLVRDKVFVYYTGEVRPLSTMTEAQLQYANENELGVITVANHKLINWTVTSGAVVLFNDWSPYRTMTIVPYFYIFRRGRTRGMVDNLRSPQEVENKAISNDLEIQNTVANSGWDIEEGSLTNMETSDLERYGAKNGLVVEYKRGSNKPERRQPMAPPVGAERVTDRAEYAIKTISGMSDAQQGQPGPEISGKAIQAKQFMGQMQMGSPFDNLAITRRLAARKILELIQDYFTEERVIRITDPETKKLEEEITINQVNEFGEILNDVTIGEYDVVVTSTPTTTTFEQSQFNEMMMMLEKGVPIPHHRVILASSLANKHEIAEEVQGAQQPPPDPEAEARVGEIKASTNLKNAQAEKARAEMVNLGIDAMYSAVQTAGVIAGTPETARLADPLMGSAGFQDKNEAPLIPELGYQGNQVQGVPQNTDPITPVPVPESPTVGVNEGIETQRIEPIAEG